MINREKGTNRCSCPFEPVTVATVGRDDGIFDEDKMVVVVVVVAVAR